VRRAFENVERQYTNSPAHLQTSCFRANRKRRSRKRRNAACIYPYSYSKAMPAGGQRRFVTALHHGLGYRLRHNKDKKVRRCRFAVTLS
jgi:hypothetical protein